ncbi:MAG TPA: hypothetical protein VND15_00560 [Candidatus Acidoferrales bacterium]|nr:hypothetical protein [Candidatus Acidoferrales bacterium]
MTYNQYSKGVHKPSNITLLRVEAEQFSAKAKNEEDKNGLSNAVTHNRNEAIGKYSEMLRIKESEGKLSAAKIIQRKINKEKKELVRYLKSKGLFSEGHTSGH